MSNVDNPNVTITASSASPYIDFKANGSNALVIRGDGTVYVEYSISVLP